MPDFNQVVENGYHTYANQGHPYPTKPGYNQAVSNCANQGDQYPYANQGYQNPYANQGDQSPYANQGDQNPPMPDLYQAIDDGQSAFANQGDQNQPLPNLQTAVAMGYFTFDDNNSGNYPSASSDPNAGDIPTYLAATQPPNGQYLPAPGFPQAYDALAPVTNADDSLSGPQSDWPIDQAYDGSGPVTNADQNLWGQQSDLPIDQAYDALGPATDADQNLWGQQADLPIDPDLGTGAQNMPSAPETPATHDGSGNCFGEFFEDCLKDMGMLTSAVDLLLYRY